MASEEGPSGVSNCYVFKCRLQEFTQKVGIPTPVYETIKEGPSHEPFFRSAVVVNDARFESLPGFLNRKAAEQSAAEIAMLELTQLGKINPEVSQPLHETGLCKNLLQEYTQKLNYAVPMYNCRKEDVPGRCSSMFSCAVDIGGIQYIGAAAKTKKEAEIKAARTALLAIQTMSPEVNFIGNSRNTELTVLPNRKRPHESISKPEETNNVKRTKKNRFRKKKTRKNDKIGQNQSGNTDKVDAGADKSESKLVQNDVTVASSEPFGTETKTNDEPTRFLMEANDKEISAQDVKTKYVSLQHSNGENMDKLDAGADKSTSKLVQNDVTVASSEPFGTETKTNDEPMRFFMEANDKEISAQDVKTKYVSLQRSNGENMDKLDGGADKSESKLVQNDVTVASSEPFGTEAKTNDEPTRFFMEANEKGFSIQDGKIKDVSLQGSNGENLGVETSLRSAGDETILPKDVNMMSGSREVGSGYNSSSSSQIDTPTVIAG